jgi:hypothetical protein
MAMTIFLFLNGWGVVFLLFVLANFWKDGHQRAHDARKYADEYEQWESPEVLVTTHPISHSAQGGLAVIPFPVRDRELVAGHIARTASRGKSDLPARRISTR